MKNIKYTLLFFASLLLSCEVTDTELTENPNALTPSNADVDFFINAAQEDFARMVDRFGEIAAEMVRIEQMNTSIYDQAYSPSSFNDEWETTYQGIFQDLKVMNALAEDSGQRFHIGMGQVFQGYLMLTLVDFFGDVPYSEALLGDSENQNLNPGADSGQAVYTAAIGLLREAVTNFAAGAPAPAVDLYYGGDADKWTKAANSILKKAYLTMGDTASYNSITNYITSSSDDFQFHWGSNEVQPDTRHPTYAQGYTSTGGGLYQSNWLMGTMNELGDPRLAYYFYRQVSAVPGFDGAAPNEETIECSTFLNSAPIHYQQNNQRFCGLSGGYWGRDHGNQDGIPPDGFLRTLPGVYPAGGTFDDGSFDGQVNGDGAGGAGITPVMLASWLAFMDAEVSPSRGALLDAVRLSLEKSDDLGGAPALADDAIQSYLNTVGFAYDNDAANTFAEQYFIALYGNGIDGYNYYRRTGYPTTLQLNIEPNPGPFPTIMWYPADHVQNNSNAAQRGNLSEKVFWNTQSPSLN